MKLDSRLCFDTSPGDSIAAPLDCHAIRLSPSRSSLDSAKCWSSDWIREIDWIFGCLDLSTCPWMATFWNKLEPIDFDSILLSDGSFDFLSKARFWYWLSLKSEIFDLHVLVDDTIVWLRESANMVVSPHFENLGWMYENIGLHLAGLLLLPKINIRLETILSINLGVIS